MSTASTVEREMLALINQERTSRGIEPLRLETQLNASSEDHSVWMLNTDRFSHTGADGSSATQRMEAAGFDFEGSWRSGENIAWQSERGAPGISDDVAQLHQNLMNSPGHRANILNPEFTYVGLGVESGEMQGVDAVIVTQNFAKTSACVILDTGQSGATGTPFPPVAEILDPAQPETPPVPAEEPEVAEAEQPPEIPVEEEVVTQDPPPEPTEGEDITEADLTATDNTEVAEADNPQTELFDVQAFLAEIDTFVLSLHARFDQPVRPTPARPDIEDQTTLDSADLKNTASEKVTEVFEEIMEEFCNIPFFEITCSSDFL